MEPLDTPPQEVIDEHLTHPEYGVFTETAHFCVDLYSEGRDAVESALEMIDEDPDTDYDYTHTFIENELYIWGQSTPDVVEEISEGLEGIIEHLDEEHEWKECDQVAVALLSIHDATVNFSEE